MSPQAGWILQEEVVPRLKSAIPNVVHCIGSEDHNELIQDATAMAASILHSAELRGKKITAGNAAFYAIQHCKSGRRSTGNSASDVHGSATQLNGRSRLNSLEEVVAENEDGGEIFELHDVLSNDQEDPGTKAARKMDWEEFCSGLSARELAAIEYLIEGGSGSGIARELGVSYGTVQTTKRHLAVKVLEFMGLDILIQVQRWPNWRNDLTATRERLACKHERSH